MPSSADPGAGFANLIEPQALLRHATAHPPLGLQPLAGGGAAPAFAAPLDLLTSAEATLRRRVQAWPGYRWWSRLLRWPAAFVGSTVTEYLPLPRGADVDVLPAVWRRGLRAGQRLVVAKDIPTASPWLSLSDNARADALAEACERDGWIVLEGQALAFVPIDFADTTEYLQRLSSSRRKDLKRKLKSRARLDVRRIATGSAAFADEATVDAYHALYTQVYAQSEVHFDQLSRGYIAALLRDGGNGGIVFEYRLQDGGALVGWNLCFEHGGLLIDKTIGMAYPLAREVDLYFVSWFVNLEHALAQGCTHYVAGWTDPEVKAQLGARFTFTRHAVYVCNPLLRLLLKPLKPLFEGDSRVLQPVR